MKHKIRHYIPAGIKAGKPGSRPEAMKYVRLVFIASFVLGILAANGLSAERLDGFGIWNTYFLEKFKYSEVHGQDLFFYILEQRIPMLLLLMLLAVTGWGIVAGVAFMGWQGFAGGFLMAASIVKYGLKGMLLAGTGLFPQYLVYIPVYIACIYLAVFFKGRFAKNGEKADPRRARDYSVYVVICAILLAVFVMGIFLESYGNPYFLKKILKIF